MKNARVGLLANQTAVDQNFIPTAKYIEDSGLKLAAIFAPQHGFTGYTQANMIEFSDSHDNNRGIPIYSLYGKVRRPTEAMLKGLDLVFVDLQDVGARGYTFVWTMLHMMEMCSQVGIKMIVMDRPNPLGGEVVEGPLLDPEYFSFVGMHDIPIRHGLTMGELANLMHRERSLAGDIEVIQMKGWKRRYYFEETGLPWIMPSPNMPTPNTALVYPGMELLEGTNLSEGRGTTRPFELFGAPFIEAGALCESLNAQKLSGVYFRPVAFQPTFDKWQGQLCQGAQIHVLDAHQFRSVTVTTAILRTVIDMYGKKFRFNDPPYEYEEKKMPFDILSGSSELREQLEKGTAVAEIVESWGPQEKMFSKRREKFLLYPSEKKRAH